jgi:hypothetical protein
MPDIGSLNTVAVADIGSVNTVAKASIGTLLGCSAPAAGATEWITAYEDGGVGYAANSDLSSWTTYYSGASNESVDWQEVCYGADNSGSLGRYVFVWTRASSPGELRYTDDITNTSGFTGVDISPATGISAELYTVAFCNGAWIAAGKMDGNQGGHIYRSTDGAATWSGINVTSLAGFGSTGIYSIAHDQSSKVIVVQDEVVWGSTDSGASWAVVLSELAASAKGLFVLYSKTEEVFVCGYHKNGLKFRTCAASDLTTWAAQQDANNNSSGKIPLSNNQARKAFAVAGSTFVVCNADSHQRFTLSGQTITSDTFTANQLPYANVKDVATDGTTWIAVHSGGDISKSTNDGATWTSAAANVAVAGGADDDMKAVTCNVLQPV